MVRAFESNWSRLEVVNVALYLGAIIVANFAVWHFGQAALPFTAFLLIPFDLVTRDVLHEKWEGDRLWPKMLALVVGGAAITALLNYQAIWVALASSLAFGSAGLINAAGFALLEGRGRLVRMNVSNVFASVADSIVFPIVAFGLSGTSWWLSATQAASKFVGGIFFSLLFVRIIWRD